MNKIGEYVTLNWIEVHTAANIGLFRRIESLKSRRGDMHGNQDAGWDQDIESACGEMAAAKVIGVYWGLGVNTFKTSGDVGCNEVRTTEKENGCLIIRNGDVLDRPFILAIGKSPNYRVVGWIYGVDAQKDEWMKNPNNREPAWFVPQEALRPIRELCK